MAHVTEKINSGLGIGLHGVDLTLILACFPSFCSICWPFCSRKSCRSIEHSTSVSDWSVDMAIKYVALYPPLLA